MIEKKSTTLDLDEVDLKILRLLQEDAKMTTKELASQLHLTTTPVHERIKKLERSGLIRKYVALLNRDRLGKKLLAYCSVSLKLHAKPLLITFEQQIQELPEVMACYHIAGGFDYLLRVNVEDMEAYHRFITHKLAILENISNVQSSFVMKEIKESHQIWI
ncbi:Lrp/AsnC family transcriptional regulator [Pontibacter sp. G13]|uniref:Lrp/AsnC family transcriptional regulator n=1 Tax=Pontibacter sp. G13 TaxID=3074898 RepID=UPI00288A6AB4|nr:Lrp/AsnC family transcriptional regulator [Pontibacter sp. G13]WNJ20995.1 Lrp/AsnC family transcriptional regulator [Pontibacter sp. G13]